MSGPRDDDSQTTPHGPGPQPLGYARPQPDDQRLGPNVWLNAGIGFFGAVGTIVVFVVTVSKGIVPQSAAIPFFLFVAVLLLVGATVVGLNPKWRGFLAGFLLAIGLMILCPFVVLLILCGNGTIKGP